MLRTVAAVLASMTLTTAVVTNAWMQKKQFYPTVGRGRKTKTLKFPIFKFRPFESPPNTIITIDAYFIRPGLCSYLLVRKNARKGKFLYFNQIDELSL